MVHGPWSNDQCKKNPNFGFRLPLRIPHRKDLLCVSASTVNAEGKKEGLTPNGHDSKSGIRSFVDSKTIIIVHGDNHKIWSFCVYREHLGRNDLRTPYAMLRNAHSHKTLHKPRAHIAEHNHQRPQDIANCDNQALCAHQATERMIDKLAELSMAGNPVSSGLGTALMRRGEDEDVEDCRLLGAENT